MSAEQNGDIKNLNVKVRIVIFKLDQRRAVSFNVRLKTLLLGSGHLPLTVDCACSRCEQSCRHAISRGCLSFVTLLEASSVSLPTSKIIFFSHSCAHDPSNKTFSRDLILQKWIYRLFLTTSITDAMKPSLPPSCFTWPCWQTAEKAASFTWLLQRAVGRVRRR